MDDNRSNWVQIADISVQCDMREFYKALSARHISYELKNRDGLVELWVEDPEQAPVVVAMLKEFSKRFSVMPDRHLPSGDIMQQFKRIPVVATLLVLSIIGALITHFSIGALSWLTFQNFTLFAGALRFESVNEAFGRGEYWRLITPIFLHFGIFHVAFNSLWLWELGRRLETLLGPVHFIAIVALMAVSSNVGQYLFSGPSLFGGMSGVVYGLLGYVWIRHVVSPNPLLAIPKPLLIFMLAWLVIAMTGVMKFLSGSGVANAAHVVGLLCGMLLGGWAGKVEQSGKHGQ